MDDKLKQHGLRAPSMHAGYDTLRDDLDAAVEDARTLGATFIVCPSIDAEQRRTADDWKRVCQALNAIGRAVRRHGITLAYHNHDFEFVAFEDGMTPFQLMMRETDPAEVKLELDVYWLAKAGLDPVQGLIDSKDRVVLVHLKDRAADGSTAELGAGNLAFEPIVRAALQVGVRHLFVEQDDSPDPLQSVTNSLRFLERLPPDVRPRPTHVPFPR
jgi:sugar phosphate isomerase/epimerase